MLPDLLNAHCGRRVEWRLDRHELTDRGVPSNRAYGSWNRVATWLPRMLMGQREGHLFYRSHTLKLARPEDLLTFW